MKMKFAGEDNHDPRSNVVWKQFSRLALRGSTPLPQPHLSLGSTRTTTHLFYFVSPAKGFNLKVNRSNELLPGHLTGRGSTSRLIVSCACWHQGVAVTVPGHRGQWDKSSRCPPKIELRLPLEQDAGCVGTSRGHRGQQSYFCSATGPPGMDAHSFIRLPAGRVVDSHRDTNNNLYTPTLSANGRSVGIFSISWNQLWWHLSCFFFVTSGYFCRLSTYTCVY